MRHGSRRLAAEGRIICSNRSRNRRQFVAPSRITPAGRRGAAVHFPRGRTGVVPGSDPATTPARTGSDRGQSRVRVRVRGASTWRDECGAGPAYPERSHLASSGTARLTFAHVRDNRSLARSERDRQIPSRLRQSRVDHGSPRNRRGVSSRRTRASRRFLREIP
jgi:hypothetical protein